MGLFIKDFSNQGEEGGLPKDDFTNKAYLLKVMTKGGRRQKFQKKIDDVFKGTAPNEFICNV